MVSGWIPEINVAHTERKWPAGNLLGIRDTILKTTGGFPRPNPDATHAFGRARVSGPAIVHIPEKVKNFLQIDQDDINIGINCVNTASPTFLSFNTVMSKIF